MIRAAKSQCKAITLSCYAEFLDTKCLAYNWRSQTVEDFVLGSISSYQASLSRGALVRDGTCWTSVRTTGMIPTDEAA